MIIFFVVTNLVAKQSPSFDPGWIGSLVEPKPGSCYYGNHEPDEGGYPTMTENRGFIQIVGLKKASTDEDSKASCRVKQG